MIKTFTDGKSHYHYGLEQTASGWAVVRNDPKTCREYAEFLSRAEADEAFARLQNRIGDESDYLWTAYPG